MYVSVSVIQANFCIMRKELSFLTGKVASGCKIVACTAVMAIQLYIYTLIRFDSINLEGTRHELFSLTDIFWGQFIQPDE